MITVDSRWSGDNGIGRYAREVIGRLTVPWQPLERGGSPSGASDFLVKRLRGPYGGASGVYTPGYNGFLRPVRQTITILDLIHLSDPSSMKYRAYYDLFLKPLVRRNRHVITISEASKTAISEWLNDDNVEVVNAGMGSTSTFSRLGSVFAADRPYLLYVGNLREHKNVTPLIQSMRFQRGVDLRIVTSNAEGALRLAERSGVADQIKVSGSVTDEELAALYRGAKATVQPSILEGFGLPAMESALCGTPVVFYEGCESVMEICAGGGRAVASARDPHAWAEALNDVGDSERFPYGLVDCGRYDWSIVASEVDSTLRKYHPAARADSKDGS